MPPQPRPSQAWTAEGTLRVEPQPRFYYYAHARTDTPDEPIVHGVAGRVLLEPWGAGIRPHEHTMPGPKADRLALLHATQTQLSPILVCYFDRSERYRHVMSRAWSDEWRARDGDGLLHTPGGDRAGRAHDELPVAPDRCSSPTATTATRPPSPTRPRCARTPAGPMRLPARSRRTGSCACS